MSDLSNRNTNETNNGNNMSNGNGGESTSKGNQGINSLLQNGPRPTMRPITEGFALNRSGTNVRGKKGE